MDLFKIRLDDSALNKIGRPNSAKILAKKVIDTLSISALRAFQAKVPVDTRELRNQIVISESTNNSATISIEDVPHYGRNKKPIQAPKLADLLNIGRNLKRTQTSISESDFTTGTTYTAIGKGSPTANWIQSGRQAFLNVSRKYLKEHGR